MARTERALQKGLVGFCREQVAEPHEFVAHDRSKAARQFTHMLEGERGIRTGFPDVEIIRAAGLPTVFCELKAPGIDIKKRKDDTEDTNPQLQWGGRLSRLGHCWFWANSAAGFVAGLRASGVALRGTADWAAANIDAKTPAPAKKARASARPRVERRVMTKHDRHIQAVRYGVPR